MNHLLTLIFRKTIMTTVKSIFRYVNENDKAQFSHSQCLLTISVGQQTHEGERFESTMALINASFGSCVLCVDDSLQRHTMALNTDKDAEFFYEISMKEGDLWLDRNEKYYSKLTIPTKIIRWNKWLNHPNYHAQQKKVKQEIESDLIYKATFEHSTTEFLEKYCQRLAHPENFDLIKARQLCFEFTLEECTALSLWSELECHFEVYPNKHNAAIEETRRRFILPHYPNLLRSVTIGFRNAKQIKPQQFSLLQNREEKVLESS